MQAATLNVLAQRLVDDGVIDSQAASRACDISGRDGTSLVHCLVRNGFAAPKTVALAVGRQFGVPVLDLAAFDVDAIARDAIDDALVRKHGALPLARRGATLHVAVADPTDAQALNELQFHAGVAVEAIVAPADALEQAVERFLEDDPPEELGDLDDADLDLDALNLEAQDNDRPGEAEESATAGADDAPVVRFINKMLLEAVKSSASDIHFERYEGGCRVRVRNDGILHEVRRPPANLFGRLTARLKVMAALDISERRVPQDGRIKMTLSKVRAVDFRVSTLPTLFGEKVVLRLLDAANARMGIESLGFEPEQEALYRAALGRPQGMILVTGPTGSGKTMTLYAGLHALNDPSRNIATVEDPVEMNLEGINQVHVNHRVGLDFAAAMRSFLRQDPDVLMVGEMRDFETADVAVKAAQTGHLVLSTLHANSAVETLTRLRNMGVRAFNLATSVSLLIAQRLARRLCGECRRATELPTDALRREGFEEEDIERGFAAYEANPEGCAQCRNGYRGRTGIYEVVPMTPALSRIVMAEGDGLQLAEQARKLGFADLRAAGLRKAVSGVTSLAEVNRVTMAEG